MNKAIFSTLGCLFSLLWVSTTSGSAHAMDLQVVGQEELVFDWSRDRCFDWHIPDAPLRAFKNERGDVVAYASSSQNIPFIGPNLNELKANCRSAFKGKNSSHAGDYNTLGWITSTWTQNGKDVLALIHNEYHAEEFPGECRFRGGASCWYNVITAATSRDGGLTFSAPEKPVLIAGPSFKQEVDQGRHRGFFNPSNIIYDDGFWYVMVSTTGGGGQAPGTCLFRTANVDDLYSWRAWDGADFTAETYNPYNPQGRSPVQCTPVGHFSMAPGSVVKHQSSGLFIAVLLAANATDPSQGTVSFYTSKDLIHWSAPKAFLTLPPLWSKACDDQFRYAYASLIDPASPSLNFDTMETTAFLYMTRLKISHCVYGQQRDLVRVKIDLKP